MVKIMIFYAKLLIKRGYAGSPQDMGDDDAIDSDCDPDTGQTDCTPIPAGDTDDTVGCGFFLPAGCLTRTPGFWGTHPQVTELLKIKDRNER